MKFRSKLHERAFTVFFMLGVTFVAISGVAAAHLLSLEKVRRFESLFLKRAVLAASGTNFPNDPAELESLYNERVRGVEGEPGCYRVLDDNRGAVRALVLTQDGSGLWGEIRAVVGFDPDRCRITGIEFVRHNETPGLGARIEEPSFREQFEGKRGPFSMVGAAADPGTGEFQALTGATVTSRGVRGLVNRACEKAERMASRGEA